MKRKQRVVGIGDQIGENLEGQVEELTNTISTAISRTNSEPAIILAALAHNLGALLALVYDLEKRNKMRRGYTEACLQAVVLHLVKGVSETK